MNSNTFARESPIDALAVQAEGCVMMGLGSSLTEEVLRNGEVLTHASGCSGC